MYQRLLRAVLQFIVACSAIGFINASLSTGPFALELLSHLPSSIPSAAASSSSAASPSTPPSRISRSLEGEGYHRQLLSKIRWDRSVKEDGKVQLNTCSLLLVESLPTTFYFDLYQLDQLYRFHSSTSESTALTTTAIQVFSEHDVELEKPSEVSKAHTVLFYVANPIWKLDSQVAETEISVPIHSRYQYSRPTSSAQNSGSTLPASISSPAVYVKCDASAAEKPITKTGWRLLSPASSESVSMQVPVGNLDELAFVRFGTFLVTIIAAVILCVLSVCKQMRSNQSPNHLD